MSGRYRIVALQAVGVAVLGVIVYLAFLSPSEPGPLSGITGPDAAQQANSGKDHHKKKPAGKSAHRGGKPGRGQGGQPGSQIPGGVADGAPAGGTAAPGLGTGQPGANPANGQPGDPNTPPGSEYQDTVARITAKLNG